MKRKIYKYPLEITDSQTVDVPEGSYLLTAQMQGSTLCLWALVDVEPERPKQTRYIAVIGTGNLILDDSLHYIATAQAGQLVWHVFERE